MSGEALSVETLRALLDAAGLVTLWVSPIGDGWHRAALPDGMLLTLPPDTDEARSDIRREVDYITARHDSAARVLGAPDLATARGLAAENAALRAEVARLAAVNDDLCSRMNAALDRVMSERDALSAQVSAMKVATLDALAQHVRAAARRGVADIIDDVCDAVGIDRQAPYRAREGDRQWARDLLARHEPTGGYDEEGGQ